MKRLKVIMSVYACEPHGGSEAGIGWNIAAGMAQHHDVWVVTRAKRRSALERELEARNLSSIHPVYLDFPPWLRTALGVQIYYYLWLARARRTCRDLHRQIGFDLAHHVTLGRYWTWSPLAWLGIPFVWGPVGGAESSPPGLYPTLGIRGRVVETMRSAARWLGERDPVLRRCAARCTLALATTPETERRLRAVGVKAVSQLSHVALNADEISRLQKSPQPPNDTICFLSMGRLLYWKGFHLGIEAFSKAGIADAQYWIVGDGPDMPRLKRLVDRLGLSGCVRLLGALPRTQALGILSRCHVLLHPSLHDSGGWVCAEAMAAGRPVICLNLGGPATIVTDECGVRVEAATPSATIAALAEAMRVLARDHRKRLAMGLAAFSRLTEVMTWEYKTDRIAEFYSEAIRGSSKKK